ncbi:hypothetical protein JXE04_00705 [Patescibacteria group bacterium]|nr:hypothetical protein [Patescibacteria group bacterium]
MKESKAFTSEIKLAIKALLVNPMTTVQLKHPFNGVYVQKEMPTKDRFDERSFSEYDENETGTFFLVYKNILG